MKISSRYLTGVLTAFCISSAAYAMPGQWGVGIETNNYFNTQFFTGTKVASVSYFYQAFAASVQVGGYTYQSATSVTDNTSTGEQANSLELNVNLGLRKLLKSNSDHPAYFTYGLTYAMTGLNTADNYGDSDFGNYSQTMVGVYVGIDYHLLSNLLLTVKALPFARTFTKNTYSFSSSDITTLNTTQNDYLNQGSIGLTYLF